MKTLPFQIPRIQLAYLASEEYLRSLWWFAATVPVFGILMVIFGQGILQIIGFTALLWPFSIPARGIASTSKASNLFSQGCYGELSDEYLTFYDTSNRPTPLRWKIPLSHVRDVIERREYYLVRMRRLGFVAIPVAAFDSESDRAGFIRTIAHAVEVRYAQNELLS